VIAGHGGKEKNEENSSLYDGAVDVVGEFSPSRSCWLVAP